MSSSELLEQIRLSRPAAPAELRRRIRGLEIEERPPRLAARTSLRLRPRGLLVALPAAALVAIAAAGAIGIARSGHADTRTAAGGGAALTQPFAQESAPPTGDSATTLSRAGKAAPAAKTASK